MNLKSVSSRYIEKESENADPSLEKISLTGLLLSVLLYALVTDLLGNETYLLTVKLIIVKYIYLNIFLFL